MTTEYTDMAGESAETIGDVLNGTGSVEETLKRMAEVVGQVNGQLESERDLRNEEASAFVSVLESFVTSVSAASDALASFESQIMEGILHALEQRFAETARFMDDDAAAMSRGERRDSFSGNFGAPGTAPGGMEGLALVRVDELNEAVTQFISALGRIEQTMEKATDIQVTVSAGDGWD